MSTRSGTAVSPGTETSTDVEAAFSRWLTPVVEPTDPTGPDARAHGAVTLHHFGYVRMLTCEAGPLRLVRSPRSAPRDAGDAVALLAPRQGTVRLAQDGRGAAVESGELALTDLRRAFSIEQRERGRLLVLRLPLHALHLPAVPLRSLTARAVTPSEGAAALLPALLPQLETAGSRVPPVLGERLGGVVADLVAGLVEDLAADAEGPPGPDRHPLLVTILEYIEAHLGDPELSAERIAAAHLISVRYLHRLFEAEGVTVGRLIQRRRVEKCAHELARRSRVTPSIAVVASRWGFRSASHFSRAFKSVHGHSPQEWRRLAGAGAEGWVTGV
ncbi:helix-turn-helix domain-containing protein [Streptomyces sp. NPDC029674]|uniref:helix-turn-helix domain-containing protein n=1 Tax=Streptomyces sp. NPDC029674 TaxID=3365297 RepID=UPI00384E0EB6